ncbi:MAG: hypothetical protein MJ240_03695 [Kiritimatiellae bacterium]|nr:hypothetical protein [Kiritimatiellia bacterium]
MFGEFANDYVIIGGSACDWLFTHRDARFRQPASSARRCGDCGQARG